MLRNIIAEYCSRLELSDAQLALLWECMASPQDGISQTDLAHRLVISPAHVSGLVEQSRRQGLLCGRRNAHDRRRQDWQLTADGRRQLDSLVEHLANFRLRVDPQFNPADLLAMVHRLTVALSDSRAVCEDCSEAARGKAVAKCSVTGPAQERGAA